MKAFVARALRYVVGPVIVGTMLSRLVTGCHLLSDAVQTADDVNMPADDVALAICRNEARMAREAGADPVAAYHKYWFCTLDAGLR